MVPIIISFVSICAVTGVIWLVNRILPFRICPICAGVFGTWIWIMIGIYLGWLEAESWKIVAAIAMGGSVVGIAYRMEERPALARATAGKLFLWKALFIPLGFAAAYGIIMAQWVAVIAVLTLLVIVMVSFTTGSRAHAGRHNKKVEELEHKMKNCC